MSYKRFNTSLDPTNLDSLDFLAKLLKTTRSGVIKLLLATADIDALTKENEKYKKGTTSHNVHCVPTIEAKKLLIKSYFLGMNISKTAEKYAFNRITEEMGKIVIETCSRDKNDQWLKLYEMMKYDSTRLILNQLDEEDTKH